MGDTIEHYGKVVAAVAGAVIGEHPLDADAVAGEEGGGSDPKRRSGGSSLVAEDLAVGEAAVSIDSRVNERVADRGPLGRRRAGSGPSPVDAPATASGDAAQFLDVDVHELAGVAHLHPTDRRPGYPIEVIESVEAVTEQNRVHRRGRQSHDPRDPSRAQPSLAAQLNDAPFSGRLRACRAPMWAAGAVLEPRHPLGLVAAPPDIGPVPGDPHRPGRVSNRPAGLDPLTQQQSTSRSQTSVTVH